MGDSLFFVCVSVCVSAYVLNHFYLNFTACQSYSTMRFKPHCQVTATHYAVLSNWSFSFEILQTCTVPEMQPALGLQLNH